MEKKNMDISREITAKDEYTIDSLFQLLKEKGKFEIGEPVRYSSMGMEFIKFPGLAKLDNLVSVKGNKISVFTHHATAFSKIMYTILDAISDDLCSLLGFGTKQNIPVMEGIAKEIERLVA